MSIIKQYCSCCFILIRTDTILSKNIQNDFQNFLLKKLLGESGKLKDIFWTFFSSADRLWLSKTVELVLGYTTDKQTALENEGVEPVEPVQMNFYQSGTYRKDLSWLHIGYEPRVQERQQGTEQQSCISVFLTYITISSSNQSMEIQFKLRQQHDQNFSKEGKPLQKKYLHQKKNKSKGAGL